MKENYKFQSILKRIIIFILVTLLEIPVIWLGWGGIMTAISMIIFGPNNEYGIVPVVVEILYLAQGIVILNLILYFLISKITKIKSYIEIELKIIMFIIILLNYWYTAGSTFMNILDFRKTALNTGISYVIAFFEFTIILLIVIYVKKRKHKLSEK